ncbi:MAG TPA: EF-P beta-lysylation protein EpmB [Gammaproteobacteria bacterium]|nr:EF-P beta-lysylation protein EpmB [Gammaproteobacteria bacterium]
MNLQNKNDWQAALINAVTNPRELLSLLELEDYLPERVDEAERLFMLKVPRGFIARMEKKNIHDPLLRQVLPIDAELKTVAGYSADPLTEAAYNPVQGLLHKYHGRVLLTYSAVCAINCRYCFRREFPYQKNNPGQTGWNDALDYIAGNASIREVILSGGDPLTAKDALLENCCEKLVLIPHITRLRIHSRIPVVLPERITDELIRVFRKTPLKIVMVIHCNHPQEISQDVREAMDKLRDAGVLLLNQSVLLKGVNDSADTLIALSEALCEMGVQPYYLHTLDRVRGTAHFDVPRQTAIKLHRTLTERLPGYLVPRLVYEKPGEPGKTPVYSG